MTEQIKNAQRKITEVVRLGYFDNLDAAMRLAASVIEDAGVDAELTPELRDALAAWGEIV